MAKTFQRAPRAHPKGAAGPRRPCDVPDCPREGIARPDGYEGAILLCREHARRVEAGVLFRDLR